MEGNAMVRSVRIASLVALWLVPLLIFVSAFTTGWVKTWQAFGVPSMTPHFLDLHSIPAGIETLRQGGDPLVANPADPMRRPLNYPRVWLYLFSTARITRQKVSTLGVIFCAFYLTCISYLIARTKHALDAAILLFASLSVAPLLAIERGNTDLLVFSVVFLACVVSNKHLKSALFGFAALLKIFPLAAMIVDAIRRPRKDRIVAALLTGVVFAVILLQWRDLRLIRSGTPIYRVKSYGVLSLEQEILFDTFQWGFLIGLGWIVVVQCWLVGAFTVSNAWKRPWAFENSTLRSKSAEMFCIFGGMYAFTYGVGGNFDYRLIFLIPTLPHVLEMGRGSQRRAWGIIYVALLILSENSIALEQYGGTVAGHAATFALFIMVLATLTRLVLGSKTIMATPPQSFQALLPRVRAPQNFQPLD